MKSLDYFPINVELTSWDAARKQLSDIRYRVFVEEQGIPVEEEIDDQEPAASHWLAYNEDGVAIGTARMLPNGCIGRMAVVREQRERGVGSAIMRHIINHAIREKIPELTLSSQLGAIPFYEGFGFIAEGPAYSECGIEHRKMRLSLHLQQQRFSRRNSDDEARQRVRLGGQDDFVEAALLLVEQARKKVRIFSVQLLPELYADKGLCEAIHNFVIQHPAACVQVLLRDSDWVSRNTHRLHELSLRLPSHIEFRKLAPKTVTMHNEFLLSDELGILYRQEEKTMTGYAVRHAPQDARELASEFDAMWEHGQADPALRRLHL